MPDIFDNAILCKNCKKIMKPTLLNRNGFNLRVIKCDKCNEMIVHPNDKQEYENFMRLKQKEFNVKMRMVGNSYSVSIPREIVDFMHEQENLMNSMVKMCFEEAGRISLKFNTPENDLLENKSEQNPRVIKSREVRIIKNGKIFHAKQISDSANPKNNRKEVIRNDLEEEAE